jgi:hypothetical protein
MCFDIAHSAPLWNLLILFLFFFRTMCHKKIANKFNGLCDWVRDVRDVKGLTKDTRGRYDTSFSHSMLCSRYSVPVQRARGSPGLGGTPAQG